MRMNQNGQSLIGVLVALSIAGLTMMLITDLSVIMVKNNLTAQANSDILSYINQIRANIQTPDNATKMLKGQPIVGGLLVKDPMSGNTLSTAGYKHQPQDAWSVKTVGFEGVIDSVVPGVKRLTIVVNIERDPNRTIGGSAARRIVGDVYCLVATGLIVTCNPDLTKLVLPVEETPPVTTKKQDDDGFKKGCSEIGGVMSNGTCTLHSGDNHDSPCKD